MALQTSGAISLNDIHVEAGGTSGTSVGINDSDVRDLTSVVSGASSAFSSFYGASSVWQTTITVGQASGNNPAILAGNSNANLMYGYTVGWAGSSYHIFGRYEAYQGSSTETTTPTNKQIRCLGFAQEIGFKSTFAKLIFSVTGDFRGNASSVFNSILVTSNSSPWRGGFTPSNALESNGQYQNGYTTWTWVIPNKANTAIPNDTGLGWTSGSTQTVQMT